MKYFLFCCFIMVALQAMAQQPRKYKIGDTAFCGIVFYVQDSGNIYQRGLVCTLQDVAAGIRWYNGQYVTTSATQDVLFGRQNALQVIKAQGKGSYAATRADSVYKNDTVCTSFGKFPWYLPSKTELLLMYKNLAAGNMVKFSREGYWSSVEYRQDSLPANVKRRKAWIVDFFNGKTFGADKSNKYHVRAVREFRNI